MYFIGNLQEDLDEMLEHQKIIELRKYKVKLSLLERDIYAKCEALSLEDKQKISELFTQYRIIDIADEE